MTRAAVSPAQLAPKPGMAMVVFVRPGLTANPFGAIVIADEHGRFLGESRARTHFTVEVPPGEHYFVGLRSNTVVVHATLAANAVYYIQVDSFPYGGPGEGVRLRPLRPQDKAAWADRRKLMKATTFMIPDPEVGQRELEEDYEDDLYSRIGEVMRELAELPADELAAHTMSSVEGERARAP
jgi:hypothetical protein